jgi:hypothetical protein
MRSAALTALLNETQSTQHQIARVSSAAAAEGGMPSFERIVEMCQGSDNCDDAEESPDEAAQACAAPPAP